MHGQYLCIIITYIKDKTMMDAMIPAIDAMKSAVAENADVTLHEVFQKAADAAKAGAEKTSEYVAKFGRARNLGERSKGSQDAGATSLAGNVRVKMWIGSVEPQSR